MTKEHKIKVQMGSNYKRESVLINAAGVEIAKGDNKAKIVREIYGR